MAKYNWKYMSESMLDEMETLLEGEHGSTLRMWSFECANAGVQGYKKGVAKGRLLGIVVGGVAIGAVHLGKKIANKIKQNKTEENEILEEVE